MVVKQGEDVSIPEANHPKQRTEHMRGKKRVQAGWSVRVICDTRIAASVKGKVYKMAVRPAVMDDFKTVIWKQK